LTRSRPNIVLIIIDSLRYDRLGCAGYIPKLTPVLDRLVANGTSCTNNYSVGCPTQIAFPGLFTSSLPFDHGGYMEGITRRPTSFVEVLQDAGYMTFGVSAAAPSASFLGYGRGFDTYLNLFSTQHWLKGTYVTKIAEVLADWRGNSAGDDVAAALLQRWYRPALEGALFILEQQERLSVAELPPSRKYLKPRIEAEIALLDRSPLAIARKMLDVGQEFYAALGEDSVTDATRQAIAARKAREKRLNRYIFLSNDRYHQNAGRINRYVERAFQTDDRPAFLFVHYFDVHEARLLIPAGNAARFSQIPLDIARAVRGRSNYHLGGFVWDLSVSYADRQLGNLISMLKTSKLDDNTIYIITADHGITTQQPLRHFGGDLTRQFFSEFLHVPLIITGEGVHPEQVSALTSHMDLGPTILEMADLSIPDCFRGLPLSQRRNDPEPYLIAENAGNGRCDMDHKKLAICIHDGLFKIIYEVQDGAVSEREIYDLSEDPEEWTNLANTDMHLEIRSLFGERVRARVSEVENSVKMADFGPRMHN